MQPIPQPLTPSLGSPRSWAVASLPASSLTGFVSPRMGWQLMSLLSKPVCAHPNHPAKVMSHSGGGDSLGSLSPCLSHLPSPVSHHREHGERGLGVLAALCWWCWSSHGPRVPGQGWGCCHTVPNSLSLPSAQRGPGPGWYLGESLMLGQASGDCQGTAGRTGMPVRATNPPWSLAMSECPRGSAPLQPQGCAHKGTGGHQPGGCGMLPLTTEVLVAHAAGDRSWR